MRFAAHGRLTCICIEAQVKRPGVERRQVCRTCGLEYKHRTGNLLNREMSRQDIERVVRNLQTATHLSANIEIPASITNLRQLNVFLASGEVTRPRTGAAEIESILKTQLT